MSVLNSEQQLLADSLRALLTKKSGSAAVRTAMESPQRFDMTLWAAMCQQIGVGGMSIAEEFGGAGGGQVEALVVAEELGRVLAPSPALGSSGLAAALVLATDDVEAKTRLLPRISNGDLIVSVCTSDAAGAWGLADIRATDDDGWALTGRAHYVLDAPWADVLLVSAHSPTGVRLYEVDAHSDGVTVTGGPTMDPTRALYQVDFDGVKARALSSGDPISVLEETAEVGMILLAGEQVGAAAKCFELTVEYSKSRVQFGRPIGSFQALKHRMADLHVLVSSARATAYWAARCVPSERRCAAAVARIHCSEALERVAAECVQLHGGVAITWEHDMQLYFKRAHSSANLFGSPRTHIRTVEAAAGLILPVDHHPTNRSATESG